MRVALSYLGPCLCLAALAVVVTLMARAALWLLVFAPAALFGVVCFTAFLTVLAMALTKDWGK